MDPGCSIASEHVTILSPVKEGNLALEVILSHNSVMCIPAQVGGANFI